MNINESAENYLETILMLSKKLRVVRSVDIANELGYKKSSISIAMKHLREKNHITVSPEGVPLQWGDTPIERHVDYFERDLTWEEEAEWYRNQVDMTNSANQLNLLGIHTDLSSIGDASHEMWNGWVKCDWCEQLVELVDEDFFIVGVAEAPYGCWAIDDAIALVAEYRDTGDRFWCHAGRGWIEDMREGSKSVYESLMKGE